MPTFAGNHRYIMNSPDPASTHIQLGNRQLHYLPLNFLSFLVARVQMRGQPLALPHVSGAEELDDRARRIHSAGRIYSRPNAKANIVSRHAGAITATATSIKARKPGLVAFARSCRPKRNHGSILSGYFATSATVPIATIFKNALTWIPGRVRETTLDQLESYANAGQILVGISAASLIWIQTA